MLAHVLIAFYLPVYASVQHHYQCFSAPREHRHFSSAIFDSSIMREFFFSDFKSNSEEAFRFSCFLFSMHPALLRKLIEMLFHPET